MTFKYNPNIYTADLDEQAVQDAIQHALDEFPLECCGSIIDNKYVKFKNEAEEPEKYFEIKDQVWFDNYIDNKIQCLVHSHNESNMASLVDQTQQIELNIPSLIINLKNRSLMDCILSDYNKIAPLEGRPFFYGIFDCISLVSDYIKQEFNIELPNPPHEWDFWVKGEKVFETILESDKDLPLYEVDGLDIQPGDIMLYNMFSSQYINHCAVATFDGTVYHHMVNNVSGRYPKTYNRKYLRKVLRIRKEEI